MLTSSNFIIKKNSGCNYRQTFIKRSVTFGTRKKWPYKTGDLLKEVQFVWNFCDRKRKR